MFLIRLVLAFGWLKKRYTDVFLGGYHEIHADLCGFCRDFFPLPSRKQLKNRKIGGFVRRDPFAHTFVF